jgi:hypothetical protein
MRTVRDESGDAYLLLKRSDESSLVRNPRSGEESYLDNDRLEPVDDDAVLETAALAVPSAVRRVLTAVPNERALGLLVVLDERGPLPVRELLGATDLCESDLHGLVAEFRAAGLLEERRVAGERGYATTDEAADALASLTGPGDASEGRGDAP